MSSFGKGLGESLECNLTILSSNITSFIALREKTDERDGEDLDESLSEDKEIARWPKFDEKFRCLRAQRLRFDDRG